MSINNVINLAILILIFSSLILFIWLMGTDKKTELPTYEEYKQQEEQRKKEEEQRRKDDTIKVTYDDLMKHFDRYKDCRVSLKGEFMCYIDDINYNYIEIKNDCSKYTICKKNNNTKFIPLRGTIKKGESFYLTKYDKLTVIGIFKGVYNGEYPYIEVDTVYLLSF